MPSIQLLCKRGFWSWLKNKRNNKVATGWNYIFRGLTEKDPNKKVRAMFFNEYD